MEDLISKFEFKSVPFDEYCKFWIEDRQPYFWKGGTKSPSHSNVRKAFDLNGELYWGYFHPDENFVEVMSDLEPDEASVWDLLEELFPGADINWNRETLRMNGEWYKVAETPPFNRTALYDLIKFIGLQDNNSIDYGEFLETTSVFEDEAKNLLEILTEVGAMDRLEDEDEDDFEVNTEKFKDLLRAVDAESDSQAPELSEGTQPLLDLFELSVNKPRLPQGKLAEVIDNSFRGGGDVEVDTQPVPLEGGDSKFVYLQDGTFHFWGFGTGVGHGDVNNHFGLDNVRAIGVASDREIFAYSDEGEEILEEIQQAFPSYEVDEYRRNNWGSVKEGYGLPSDESISIDQPSGERRDRIIIARDHVYFWSALDSYHGPVIRFLQEKGVLDEDNFIATGYYQPNPMGGMIESFDAEDKSAVIEVATRLGFIDAIAFGRGNNVYLDEEVTASILSPIHDQIADEIWDIDAMVIEPELEEFIWEKLDDALSSYDTHYRDHLKRLYVIGSITGRQYSEDSDVDVNVYLDIDEWSFEMGEDPEELRNSVRKALVNQNGDPAPGATHPVNFFLSSTLDDPPADGIYDVLRHVWIKHPDDEYPEDFDPYVDFKEAFARAEELAERVDAFWGGAQRAVDGYLMYGNEEQRSRYIHYLKDLTDTYETLAQERRDMFEIGHKNDIDVKVLQRATSNVVYKALDMWGLRDKMLSAKSILEQIEEEDVIPELSLQTFASDRKISSCIDNVVYGIASSLSKEGEAEYRDAADSEITILINPEGEMIQDDWGESHRDLVHLIPSSSLYGWVRATIQGGEIQAFPFLSWETVGPDDDVEVDDDADGHFSPASAATLSSVIRNYPDLKVWMESKNFGEYEGDSFGAIDVLQGDKHSSLSKEGEENLQGLREVAVNTPDPSKFYKFIVVNGEVFAWSPEETDFHLHEIFIEMIMEEEGEDAINQIGQYYPESSTIEVFFGEDETDFNDSVPSLLNFFGDKRVYVLSDGDYHKHSSLSKEATSM